MNFADRFLALKRRANLTGRPLTQEDVAALAKGEAEAANLRLTRGKQVQLQKQEIGLRSEALEETKRSNLAREKEAVESREATAQESVATRLAQIKAADRARKLDYINLGIQAPITAATTLYMIRNWGK